MLLPTLSQAGPWVEVGNSSLRSDIQILADAGVITGAVTTWPLAWGDIVGDLNSSAELTSYQEAALYRVRKAAKQQTAIGQIDWHARVSYANEAVQLRSFENTPRAELEGAVGASWTGKHFAAKIQATRVDNSTDSEDWWADGSYLGVVLGNWSLTGSVQDRWWGPGWQGSMILSNNARPIPAITFERISTDPFKTKWLAWLGHWDFSMMVGQLEEDRHIPDALFFGMRLTLRPFKSLELGVSRTAQLCGEGRPCNWDTWTNMLLGDDNRGDNVSKEDEPGNQLAGWDIRWSNELFKQPFALYTQWTGEDEGGGLPAKYSGQFGGETWGMWERLGTYRMYLEWSDTMCNFALYKGSDKTVPDCAYNHGIYEDGYRYRGRAIAHTFDNDASIFTFSTILTDNSNNSWILKLGYGNLNRQRNTDLDNTVESIKHRYREILVSHRRSIFFGNIDVGAGYDYREQAYTGEKTDEVRFYIEWTYDTWD